MPKREKVRQSNLGKKMSAETRAKLSEILRNSTNLKATSGPLLTEAEREAIRTLPTKEAAARTGRTLRAVYSQRCLMVLTADKRKPSQMR